MGREKNKDRERERNRGRERQRERESKQWEKIERESVDCGLLLEIKRGDAKSCLLEVGKIRLNHFSGVL